MKITDECKMHLQTADLLLQGIRESMAVLEKGEFLPPPGTLCKLCQQTHCAGQTRTAAGRSGTSPMAVKILPTNSPMLINTADWW